MKKLSLVIKFFTIAMICIGILFYFNEKIQFSNYRTVLFVIAPILLGIFLLLVNFNTKIIIFNTIIIFGFFSFFLEVFFLLEKNNNQNNFNQVVLDSNKNIPQLCGTFFINTKKLNLYPLGGISNIPVKLKNKFTKKETIENTDNFGFKNSNKWSIDSDIDFVFIGDSFTYGADVAHKEGFFDYFTSSYPNSINFGCGGTGPIIQKAIFSEYVKNLKPNYVIWNLNLGNDINSDLPREYNSFYKNYLDNDFSQNLISRQSDINKLHMNFWSKFVDLRNIEKKKYKENNLSTNNNSINFIDILKLNSLRNFLGLKFSFSPSTFETLKLILYQVKKETNEWNGKLIINIIPSDQKYISLFHQLDYNSYNSKIINFVKENDFNYIDLSNYINKDNYYKYFDGHFTILGNKLVSEIILDKVN